MDPLMQESTRIFRLFGQGASDGFILSAPRRERRIKIALRTVAHAGPPMKSLAMRGFFIRG